MLFHQHQSNHSTDLVPANQLCGILVTGNTKSPKIIITEKQNAANLCAYITEYNVKCLPQTSTLLFRRYKHGKVVSNPTKFSLYLRFWLLVTQTPGYCFDKQLANLVWIWYRNIYRYYWVELSDIAIQTEDHILLMFLWRLLTLGAFEKEVSDLISTPDHHQFGQWWRFHNRWYLSPGVLHRLGH